MQSLSLLVRPAPSLKCHSTTVVKSTSFSPNMAYQVFNINCREMTLSIHTKIKVLLWQVIVSISENFHLEEISVNECLAVKSHTLSILGRILHPLLSMATLLTLLEPGFQHLISQSFQAEGSFLFYNLSSAILDLLILSVRTKVITNEKI